MVGYYEATTTMEKLSNSASITTDDIFRPYVADAESNNSSIYTPPEYGYITFRWSD